MHRFIYQPLKMFSIQERTCYLRHNTKNASKTNNQKPNHPTIAGICTKAPHERKPRDTVMHPTASVKPRHQSAVRFSF